MLEEDYEEEGFFAAVRKGYWQAPEGSALAAEVAGTRAANQKSAPCGVSKSRCATPATRAATSAKRIGLPTTLGSLL